jgi:threonine/homoserine/homoserine lactone efflux protein
VSGALVESQTWLRLGGGIFLCYLGARTFLARPAERAAPATARGLAGAYASTLVLTLTNPMTILSFVAIFAGLGITAGGYASASALVAGVFAGSALWWLLLSGGVGLVRARVRPSGLAWVNRLSGAVIAAFGVLALLGAR